MRVYELAKQLDLPSAVVLRRLRELGYVGIRSAATTLGENVLPAMYDALAGTDAKHWEQAKAEHEAEQQYWRVWEHAHNRVLLTTNEAAQLCNVAPATIRQWVARGKLTQAVHDRQGVMFDLVDLAKVEHSTRKSASPILVGEEVFNLHEDADGHDLIDGNDAARLMRVSPATIRQWVARGKLSAVALDGRGVKLYRLVDLAKVEHSTRKHPAAAGRRQPKIRPPEPT